MDSRHSWQYFRHTENAKKVGALLLEGLTREETAERLGFSMWRVQTLERKFWRERPTYLAESQVQTLPQSAQVF
jgi:hypothetical protein